jgi:nitrogen-specific signal transduction histidine kinase
MIREHRKYKKMQESLIQSREMKVLGELAGGVAHEFNNLLTPILGYTQILKKKVNDPSLLRYIINFSNIIFLNQWFWGPF